MGWPQWVTAVLLVLQVLGGWVLHGKAREPFSFSGAVLSAAIMALLLQAGGFWR